MLTDLIAPGDKYIARGVLLALLEHIAAAARADADEHFDKIAARYRKNRHIRFPGNRAGEQGLAGAGRPDQQHALRNLSAKPLKFLRVLQVLDDLLELLLGLVDARDVLKGDTSDLLGQQPRPALAKTHSPATATLHLSHEEDPHADQHEHREPGNQHAKHRRNDFVDR